ncbi:class I SAM-dependent methyltransferase [Sulfurimonas sp. HSL-1716]|uniref:class I SAM-dependent DNA methyltransferase n=1 Tax=Hydrocurvibacter sulfurireducens TaxID=3131937 RepID=UPI0031F7DB68
MSEKSTFDNRAEGWDSSSMRVQLAQNTYNAIVKEIPLKDDMDVIDFGAGTGLLSRNIALHVNSLLGIDTSRGMLEKLDALEMDNVVSCYGDFCEFKSVKKYDGIVSSMTMHHIKELDKLFTKMHELLKEGGFIAIADLMSEDGTFHPDNEGVHHFGFDEDELVHIAKKHGFKEVRYEKIFEVEKEGKNPYGIFLLTARR